MQNLVLFHFKCKNKLLSYLPLYDNVQFFLQLCLLSAFIFFNTFSHYSVLKILAPPYSLFFVLVHFSLFLIFLKSSTSLFYILYFFGKFFSIIYIFAHFSLFCIPPSTPSYINTAWKVLRQLLSTIEKITSSKIIKCI